MRPNSPRKIRGGGERQVSGYVDVSNREFPGAKPWTGIRHYGWRAVSRNVIQTTFDDFMKSAGFSKKSGSWYRTTDEVITVVELQKSQYGLQYFVNIALWLRPLGEATAPKEHVCHVRTRLSGLVGNEEGQLEALLDLDVPTPDSERAEKLTSFLEAHMGPALEAVASLDSLRVGAGRKVVAASLVRGPAQVLLAV